MNHTHLITALGAGVCIVSQAFAADGWGTDFNAGLATAAAEGRTMLVEFTGSDWCPPCMQLRGKILPTQAFKDFAEQNKLVLVELDFPRAQGKVTPEEEAVRNELAEKYRVEGFPTMLVTDGKGVPYAKVVGSAMNADAYIDRLRTALEIKAAFEAKLAAAAELTGVESAKAKVEALNLLDEETRLLHTELIADILKNDPEDLTGYRKATAEKELFEKQIGELSRIVEESLSSASSAQGEEAAMKGFIASRQKLLEMAERDDLLPRVRLICYGVVVETYLEEKDIPHALEYVDKAIAAAPDSEEAKELQDARKQIEQLSAPEPKKD